MNVSRRTRLAYLSFNAARKVIKDKSLFYLSFLEQPPSAPARIERRIVAKTSRILRPAHAVFRGACGNNISRRFFSSEHRSQGGSEKKSSSWKWVMTYTLGVISTLVTGYFASRAFNNMTTFSGLTQEDLFKLSDILDVPLPKEWIYRVAALERLQEALNVYQEACFQKAYALCQKGEWEKILAVKSTLTRLVDARGHNLFLSGAYKGDQSVVEGFIKNKEAFALEDGASFLLIKFNGNNALHLAASQGRIEVLPLLKGLFHPIE
jgi:hypothetical protein